MAKIVFACVANGGRSVMAEAFAKDEADPAAVEVVSAGSKPGKGVHPIVSQAMSETGRDVFDHSPRLLTPEVAKGATILVTMGCGEACPYIPGAKIVDWKLPDPKDKPLGEVRKIRDDIKF